MKQEAGVQGTGTQERTSRLCGTEVRVSSVASADGTATEGCHGDPGDSKGMKGAPVCPIGCQL